MIPTFNEIKTIYIRFRIKLCLYNIAKIIAIAKKNKNSNNNKKEMIIILSEMKAEMHVGSAGKQVIHLITLGREKRERTEK